MFLLSFFSGKKNKKQKNLCPEEVHSLHAVCQKFKCSEWLCWRPHKQRDVVQEVTVTISSEQI